MRKMKKRQNMFIVKNVFMLHYDHDLFMPEHNSSN